MKRFLYGSLTAADLMVMGAPARNGLRFLLANGKGHFKYGASGMIRCLSFVIIIAFSLSGTANAAHPLITYDAGTLGKGNSQF